MGDVEVTTNELNRPSEFGSMTFSIKVKPVSSQAGRAKKDMVTDAIRAVTKPVKYLLSSDVSVEIVWFINEDERYESDASADVDNIIKPILDALSGPDGIIINDEEEYIEITIKYEPDAWYQKDSIIFVQLHKALCMPVCSKLPPVQLKILLDTFETQINARERFLVMGENYYIARTVMSIQRLYHKTRITDFKIVTLEDLRVKMETGVIN